MELVYVKADALKNPSDNQNSCVLWEPELHNQGTVLSRRDGKMK